MGFSLIPSLHCDSIYTIDIEHLKERGIRLLLLDLDNTLIPYGVKQPDERLCAWARQLEAQGITPFVLSNSRKPTRVQEFAKALAVPFVRRAGKPQRKGFLEALRRMDCTPSQACMVGDQIFTDILGANRSDIFSILVTPIRQDTIFRKIRFCLETPFRRRAGK